jgi:hypothetical protein
LECQEPIEIGDFVSSITSIGVEYERFVKAKHPDTDADPKLYVKHVREGSIIVDFVPWLFGAGVVGIAGLGIVGVASAFNTLDEFVERLHNRISPYLQKRGRVDDATKPELQHYAQMLAAVANNSNSRVTWASMEHVIDRVGEQEITRIAVGFRTSEAQEISDRLHEHVREITHTERVDHSRVLLRFTRTDTATVRPGEPTGEKVIIEKLSPKPRRVVYASDLVEARFKHEIRDDEDNIYKKVFLVDVNVEMQRGLPFAYSVTHIHEVYDMDDDD